jgi:hypothetical protein
MGKYKLSTILTVVGLIVGIPASIVAFQTIERPWAPKAQVERIDTEVAGLRYESLMSSYLRCKANLRKDPNNRWLQSQCIKLLRLLKDLEKRGK